MKNLPGGALSGDGGRHSETGGFENLATSFTHSDAVQCLSSVRPVTRSANLPVGSK